MAFLLELPGAYVDAIVLDTVTLGRPALMNRDPEPNETNVPLGVSVQFDLTDIGPDGIDLAATLVYINGTLAFNGGTFLAGFTGPGSSSSNPQPDTLRVVVDPTTPFQTEALVTVRVVSNVVGGGFAFDSTYTFTIEDVSPPVLYTVTAIGLRQVRVQFDDPVRQLSVTAASDALTKGNYALTRMSVPAVVPNVIEVQPVAADTVDLITDIDITPGADYRLTVNNVQNVNGFAIDPDSIFDFVGFVPDRPPNRQWDLYKLLPPTNILADATQDLKRFYTCLQEVNDIALALIDTFVSVVDFDTADSQYLDAILADFSNPFDFVNLSIENRRRLAAYLVQLYQQKGTAVGIVNAIRFLLGVEAVIVPYDGATMFLGLDSLNETFILAPSLGFVLRAFRLSFSVPLTTQQRQQARRIARYMKPVNTHVIDVQDPGQVTADHLMLGLSRLGDIPTTTPGTGNGTWILHE